MAKKLAIVVVALAAILVGAQMSLAQQTQENANTERIAISALKKKLDSGEKFLLIDVREDWELKKDGAIPGALHIPVADLDKRMKDIPKDIEIVFY